MESSRGSVARDRLQLEGPDPSTVGKHQIKCVSGEYVSAFDARGRDFVGDRDKNPKVWRTFQHRNLYRRRTSAAVDRYSKGRLTGPRHDNRVGAVSWKR